MLIQPLALIGTERVHAVGAHQLNPLVGVKAVVGEPYAFAELVRKHEDLPELNLADCMLVDIARMLPKQYQGFYAKYV